MSTRRAHSLCRVILPGLLAAVLAGCGAGRPGRVVTPPSPTPFPFVTATPRPTSTPLTPTPTPTPFPTLRATATPPPSIRRTPTPALTLTPGAALSTTPGGAGCPAQPAGLLLAIYESRPDLQAALGCVTVPSPDSAPQVWAVAARYQPMERGHLLALSRVGWYEGRVVYVMLADGTYTRFDDTYIAGSDPASGGPVPPPGLFQPVDNLGKTWRTVPGLIDQIGFGLEAESLINAEMQLYQFGEMVYLPGREELFVFWRAQPDSWALYRFSPQAPGG